MSRIFEPRAFNPKDRPPAIATEKYLYNTSPLPEDRPAVTSKNYIAGRFVVRGYRSTHKRKDRRESLLLGLPYCTERSGTSYYCRVLTETGVFESRVPALVYLSEAGQTDELKAVLARARELTFKEGEEGLIRKLQLSRLH